MEIQFTIRLVGSNVKPAVDRGNAAEVRGTERPSGSQNDKTIQKHDVPENYPRGENASTVAPNTPAAAPNTPKGGPGKGGGGGDDLGSGAGGSGTGQVIVIGPIVITGGALRPSIGSGGGGGDDLGSGT